MMIIDSQVHIWAANTPERPWMEGMEKRGWELMSHGIYNTRYHWGFSVEEERAAMLESREIHRRLTGREQRGWFSPAITNTMNTFDLAAECGFSYTADLYHDDQPFPLRVKKGKLVSLPYTVELNDVLLHRRGEEADEEGDPRPPDREREHGPTEVVRPERESEGRRGVRPPVARARRGERLAVREQGCRDRDEDEEGEDAEPPHPHPVAPEHRPGPSEGRAPSRERDGARREDRRAAHRARPRGSRLE